MLSMAVGLLRPDEGRSQVFGVDVWTEPLRAKALMGVLPDGLAMPEQLTGLRCSRIWAAYEGSIRTTLASGPASCWRCSSSKATSSGR
jgi:ABC-type multidrug transport system ATPase subunit